VATSKSIYNTPYPFYGRPLARAHVSTTRLPVAVAMANIFSPHGHAPTAAPAGATFLRPEGR
jgi:hypothetical protein